MSLTGAVCGSAILDEDFEELLQTEFKRQHGQPIPLSTVRAARQYWQDYIKPTFRGPLDEDDFEETPYQVPLPGVASSSGNHGFNGGFWYMEQYVHWSIADQPRSNTLSEILIRI